MDTTQPVRRAGGRSARVRAAVHDAVKELIAENGPGQVSIAEVAARSGVHPTSIYKRWGTPEALALDVAVARLEADLPMPDTGTLRGDLLVYATQATEDLSRPDGLWLVHAILTARGARGGADFLSYLQSRANQIQHMLDRARQRKEPELHFTDVIDGVLGPIYMRTLFGIGGLDRAYLAALIERTINAPIRVPDTSPAPSARTSTPPRLPRSPIVEGAFAVENDVADEKQRPRVTRKSVNRP
jgi:AcrR family transcriptional regulator